MDRVADERARYKLTVTCTTDTLLAQSKLCGTHDTDGRERKSYDATPFILVTCRN